jgi:hypothetical protein
VIKTPRFLIFRGFLRGFGKPGKNPRKIKNRGVFIMRSVFDNARVSVELLPIKHEGSVTLSKTTAI